MDSLITLGKQIELSVALPDRILGVTKLLALP